ncbi:ImmA/IrrE family metallo-endopeptidase [Shewanella insulae]|uniref:ImmA/IrrE family metallo-endopeptidase n=1 Tax=Shewanella insulae TaxID=2681496 RepID=UPI001EFE1463|nr:ImmA/IrrE family metallo-endopeptidase [Shewanella insulae]MCG9755027.1 ImmA/IrrE family metallo-endopeptidase [Shewanella insulae]
MDYRLRGTRVDPYTEKQIISAASIIADELKFCRRDRKRCDKAFERLSEYGITISVIPDDEWLGLTKGHYDPSTFTISVPNHIYVNACKGEKNALEVMLHELGHLFLLHKAVLHYTDSLPTKEEDSEWQADFFAEVILKRMGYSTKQLSFDFYRKI